METKKGVARTLSATMHHNVCMRPIHKKPKDAGKDFNYSALMLNRIVGIKMFLLIPQTIFIFSPENLKL